ncbi:MAG: hypothetical protein ACOZBL_06000 [Patescibacteria group bacterium]
MRTSKKIRVRQPLSTLTIANEFNEYYQEILKEELNIKQVIVSKDILNIVKKICKPNAKIL